jgi:hypothetical protein
MGRAVSGVEPRGQALGVNFLFVALLVVVLGWFVLGLRTGWSLERRKGAVVPGSTEVRIPGERPAAESA